MHKFSRLLCIGLLVGGCASDHHERVNEAPRPLDQPLSEVLLERGVELREEQRYSEAIAVLENVLTMRPQHVRAAFERARTFMAWGHYEDALVALDQVETLDPSYFGLDSARGACLLRFGRLEDACDAFTREVRRYPLDAGAHAQRASVLFDLGRADEALAATNVLIVLEPNDSAASLLRARALLALARPGDALEELDRTICEAAGHEAVREAALRELMPTDGAGLAVEAAETVSPPKD